MNAPLMTQKAAEEESTLWDKPLARRSNGTREADDGHIYLAHVRMPDGTHARPAWTTPYTVHRTMPHVPARCS